ncbi:MAG: NAD(P)H-hydrate dehydratase [Verrucomicrobiota bacterium]
MKILSPQSIQQWETETIQSGVTTEVLMQQAVAGLHEIITERFPAGQALVTCGKGNNGNDALWLADRLKESGWQITVWSTHPLKARADASSLPEPVLRSLQNALVFPDTPDHFFNRSEPLLIIDGILGLGASGAPRGTLAQVIRWLMQHRRPQDVTLSIDTPSGLDDATGDSHDPCFKADMTLMIGAVKAGCCLEKAASVVGRISAVPIDLNPPGPAADAGFFIRQDARELIRHRQPDTHKHREGAVHIWAGSRSMTGAAILASRAALRSGAGLVRLFTAEDILPYLLSVSPEIMVESITLSKKLNPRLLEGSALLAGPGIGLDPATHVLLEQVLEQARCPLIIDADGITHCASEPSLLARLPPGTIMTPHLGEFSRLLPRSYRARDRDARLFTTLNPDLTLVLKGPNTLVAAQPSGLSYNGSGNPGMATAGSGDVLAGLITGLRARGFNAWNAARLGVFWHGLAGDFAAQNGSEDTLTASDQIESLAAARASISRP